MGELFDPSRWALAFELWREAPAPVWRVQARPLSMAVVVSLAGTTLDGHDESLVFPLFSCCGNELQSWGNCLGVHPLSTKGVALRKGSKYGRDVDAALCAWLQHARPDLDPLSLHIGASTLGALLFNVDWSTV